MAMEFMFVPRWLEVFLSITTFFSECEEHTEHIRRECNMYCFDCCSDKPLCLNCVKYCHKDHRIIQMLMSSSAMQIRRSSYHNVVRIEDIEDELDTSGIQLYVINNSDVVFLNKRDFDMHRTKRTGKSCRDTSLCNICRRSISNTSRFCSLGCKFAWTKKSESGSSDQSTNNAESSREVEEQEITKRLALKVKGGSNSRKRKETPEDTPNSRKRKGTPLRAPFY